MPVTIDEPRQANQAQWLVGHRDHAQAELRRGLQQGLHLKRLLLIGHLATPDPLHGGGEAVDLGVDLGPPRVQVAVCRSLGRAGLFVGLRLRLGLLSVIFEFRLVGEL